MVERVTADQLAPGDGYAVRRAGPWSAVVSIDSIGASSRYIRLEGGGRIRPRHTTKVWRRR